MAGEIITGVAMSAPAAVEAVSNTLMEANPEGAADMAAVLAETAPGAADDMIESMAVIWPEFVVDAASAMAEANPMAAEGTAGAMDSGRCELVRTLVVRDAGRATCAAGRKSDLDPGRD